MTNPDGNICVQEQVDEHWDCRTPPAPYPAHVDGVVVMVKGSTRKDTRDTSLLESQERLEKHYSL